MQKWRVKQCQAVRFKSKLADHRKVAELNIMYVSRLNHLIEIFARIASVMRVFIWPCSSVGKSDSSRKPKVLCYNHQYRW